ncbi:uncharacterized protein B0T15DRAFT_151065 [Chaetomium strumarium]|uniref:DHHA2 domain-containing protein n=1 Tax=Chaetomium strumarium TaxID=1170767 RepID=A0AAJ0GV67_9PEZI|nr:hypothetical protein B0T15DRAFT_151065 [Chaetomium strumarium]
MPASRTSLAGFLTAARAVLVSPPAQRPKPLTFVVGNESADLDSICSAIFVAYFRSHTPPYALHIPLSNLPRADLALRPELNAVLHPAHLSLDHLITLSDLPREEDLGVSDTRWLLVDHNVWTGRLAARFPSPVIVGCIDHHEDEGVVPTALPAGQPRVFAKCGSCMSLVVEQCKETWDRLSCEGGPTSKNPTHCDAALARIALAPILVDTANLTSKDKTTERDVSAVRVAESKLLSALSASSAEGEGGGGGGGEYERGKFYDELARLKEQIAGMPYRDVLRKDYKRWREGSLSLGVSSVVQGFEYVVQEVGDKDQAAFLGALRDWAAEQELDVVAVMTVSRPGGVFTRELLVWGLNEEGAKAAREFDLKYGSTLGLESWKGGELDGGSIQGTNSEGLRMCWTQRAIENSRKQVGPMLRAAMRESSRL